MQTRSSDEKAVRLSVCQTRGLWQNGRKTCPDFYTIRKIIYPSFLTRRMVGGGDPFYLKFWVNWPCWREIADFEQIFARSASAVKPSEKSSINTNSKSTTRFLMSLRWSSYVAPKSPKGAQKRKTAVFRVKSHLAWRKSATLCEKCQRQSCKAFIDLTVRTKMTGGDVLL